MKYLNKEQIKENIRLDRLVKERKICSACGRVFSEKRLKSVDPSLCQECYNDVDFK